MPLSLCPGRGARTAPPPLPCAPSRVGVGRWEGVGVREVEGQGEGERGEEGVGEGVEEVEGQGEGTLRPLDVPRAPLKGPYLN